MKLNLAYQPNRRTETLGLTFAKRIQDPGQVIHRVTYDFFYRGNPHSRLHRLNFWYGMVPEELLPFRPVRSIALERFTTKDINTR